MRVHQLYKQFPLLPSVAVVAAMFMGAMALLSMASSTLAHSYFPLPASQPTYGSMVDAMYLNPRILLASSNSSNHTYLGMLNTLLATDCADFECVCRAFDSREAKVQNKPGIGWLVGTAITLLLCTLHYVASTLGKQTVANGGIPAQDLSSEHDAFHSAEAMLRLCEGEGGAMEEQARCGHKSQLRINLNLPWYDEPQSTFMFGGVPGEEEKTVGAFGHFKAHQDWLCGKAFPNGQSRTDSPLLMSWGLWSWFLNLTGSNWWSFLMKVLQGVLLPISAQLASKVIGVLEDGEPNGVGGKLAKQVLGTRASMLLLYVSLILLVQFVFSSAQWSFDMEVPYAGPWREIKLRLAKKFMTIEDHGAKTWPAGRCVHIISQDVPAVMSSWEKLFLIVQDMTSIITTVILTALNSSQLLDAVEIVPMLFIAVAYTAIDVNNRKEQILDLVSRKRMWLSAEDSMVSREVHHQKQARSAQIHQNDIHAAAEAKKAVNFDRAFFCVSFVAWYRISAAYFVTLGAQNMIACFNTILLHLVIVVDAYDVIQGTKTLEDFTADVLLTNIYISVVKSLHGHFIALLKNTPSICAVAEVLNMGEVFEEGSMIEGDEYEFVSDDDEEIQMLTPRS